MGSFAVDRGGRAVSGPASVLFVTDRLLKVNAPVKVLRGFRFGKQFLVRLGQSLDRFGSELRNVLGMMLLDGSVLA